MTPPPPDRTDALGRRDDDDDARVRLHGTASGRGRLYQAGRDQSITEVVLPEAAVRPVAEVAAPPRLVNVPVHAQLFVGRGGELAELQAALTDAAADSVAGPVADSVAGPVVVVHGLGGIGKSTLAARYAGAQAQAGVNPVWWITADTPAELQAGLAALAAAL